MIIRPFWQEQVQALWTKAPVVWLSGVRRVGKTTLARSLENARFVNCDLPVANEMLSDPEAFYRGLDERFVIFDEVHSLQDPSRLLKIGADVFPQLRILATGSSTLAATRKFRDSLTGRKRNLHLPPVLVAELDAFGVRDLRHRLFRGGLPEALLAPARDSDFYAEWIDSYYARDVEELFRVEKRKGFLLLLELLLRQSGGLLEVTSLARACGLSRATVVNYLNVFEITHTLHVLRPFHGGGRQELLRQPKAYGFDTGFVAYVRGWNELRSEDCGLLWEHLVLDTLLAHGDPGRVHYWRDKQGREMDFVVPVSDRRVDVVEAKWDHRAFEGKNLAVFRSLYPEGRNFVISPQVAEPYERTAAGHRVVFTNPNAWASRHAHA